MIRLCQKNIDRIPDHVRRPGYNPSDLEIGMVHLGIGAFHRAHQAVYTDNIIEGGDYAWGIAGVSLRSATARDQLQPQDGLYTLVEQNASGRLYRMIASVKKLLVAPEDPAAVLKLMQHQNTKIVSLTITEKGYCHDPTSGSLNFAHPDIKHDLTNPHTPKTAIGFIFYALQHRLAAGHRPFTPLTCDNLPNNGKLLKEIILQFAQRVDRALATQIEQNVSFPCTMVDRIVPATAEEDKLLLSSQLNYQDQAMVKTETFSQWVIEDNFVNERPAWEKVGVNLVRDVQTFEEMKLRLLNGSHSAIAYLGYLAGLKYVHQVIERDDFKQFIQELMDNEVTPSLIKPDGINLENYKADLIGRFSNPALNHRTHQIAMDGSQKLPQRLLNTLQFLIRNDLPYSHIALVLAAWIRYISGSDDAGNAIDVQDPMAAQFKSIASDLSGSPSELVTKITGIEAIFGTDLSENSRLIANILFWYRGLDLNGTLHTVAHFKSLAKHAAEAS